MVCTVVEAEIMMIMIKLMNDEGQSDNISDESDDNDNDDVVEIFFCLSLPPSVMKTTIFQLHMDVVVDSLCVIIPGLTDDSPQFSHDCNIL